MMSFRWNISASERMSAALAPRPCTMIIAARAAASPAPACSTGCPRCGSDPGSMAMSNPHPDARGPPRGLLAGIGLSVSRVADGAEALNSEVRPSPAPGAALRRAPPFQVGLRLIESIAHLVPRCPRHGGVRRPPLGELDRHAVTAVDPINRGQPAPALGYIEHGGLRAGSVGQMHLDQFIGLPAQIVATILDLVRDV